MKVAQTTTEQISVGNCLEDLLGGMLEEKIIETIGNAINVLMVFGFGI